MVKHLRRKDLQKFIRGVWTEASVAAWREAGEVATTLPADLSSQTALLLSKVFGLSSIKCAPFSCRTHPRAPWALANTPHTV